MITWNEVDRIRRHIGSCEHDIVLQEPCHGESLLSQDVLAFRRGPRLTVVCIGLTDKSNWEGAIEDLTSKGDTQSIVCLRAHDSNMRFLSRMGFKCEEQPRASIWDREMILRFEGASLWRFLRRVRETQRVMRKERIVCEVKAGANLTDPYRALLKDRHLALLSKFVDRKKHKGSVSKEDDDFFRGTPSALRNIDRCDVMSNPDRRDVRVDATVDGKLVGFALGHMLYAPRMAMFSICAFDNTVRSVCDCLYSELLSYFRSQGVESCNLSTSIHEGVFWYKKKWGAEPHFEPCAQSVWTREP